MHYFLQRNSQKATHKYRERSDHFEWYRISEKVSEIDAIWSGFVLARERATILVDGSLFRELAHEPRARAPRQLKFFLFENKKINTKTVRPIEKNKHFSAFQSWLMTVVAFTWHNNFSKNRQNIKIAKIKSCI